MLPTLGPPRPNPNPPLGLTPLLECPEIGSRAPTCGPEAGAPFGAQDRGPAGSWLTGQLLVGWPAGWLDGRPAVQLASLHGWLADWLADRLADGLAGWLLGLP